MSTKPAFKPASLLALLAATAVLGGCGQAASSTPSSSQATPAAEAAGGEAAAVRYQNDAMHYRVDAPGPMQVAADGTASASRGVERLSVQVVTGTSAADLKAYAQTDLQRVQGSASKFHLTQPLTAVSISGHPAWKATYTWTDGTNPVTGKPDDLVTNRYYIPRNGSTAAVLTYGISASQYDPQGADDVAATFTWI